MISIGINGFGRIGRLVCRAILERGSPLELVAINNPCLSIDEIVYLLKYDSVHGILNNYNIKSKDGNLVINGKTILVFSEKDPSNIPWGEYNVDYICESSGFLEHSI